MAGIAVAWEVCNPTVARCPATVSGKWDDTLQSIAVFALAHTRQPDVTPVLLSLLGEERLKIQRYFLILALGITEDPQAVPALLDALAYDNHDTVWQLANEGLSRIGLNAVPFLIESLRSKDDRLRAAAAQRLGTCYESPVALPALLEAVRDPDGSVRQAAASSLREFQDNRAVSALLLAMCDRDPEVRESAFMSLLYLDEVTGLSALLGLLKHPDLSVRRQAGRMCSPLYTLGVRTLLGGNAPEKHLRRQSAITEGRFTPPAHLSDVAKHLGDTEFPMPTSARRVCDFAAEALECIGTDEALAILARWKAISKEWFTGQ
jgi:HEAT repeat protein